MRRRRRLADEERAVGAFLAAGRIAIGVGIWAAPSLTSKALGLDRWSGQGLAVARLAATRDVLLGAWLVNELREGGKPLAPAAALTACDAGDALTFALLAADGEPAAGMKGLAAAGPATALGVWLVSRLRG